MSEYNWKPSVSFPTTYAAGIAPQAVAAAATATGGWVSAKEVKWAKIISFAGAGAGTFAVKLEQATSSGGAGAKDLATAATLGITAQANGTLNQVDFDVADNIDTDNAFAFIRLSVTCTGGTTTLYAATIETGPAARQS